MCAVKQFIVYDFHLQNIIKLTNTVFFNVVNGLLIILIVMMLRNQFR